MSIPVPNLDDRSFADLVQAARDRIQRVDPEWTDLSVHDPGIVLVEAFAHLTDTLLYRLNRVPDKLYAVYLGLLGTSLHPPTAAEATLEFSRLAPTGPQILIPRGTQVGPSAAIAGQSQPLFVTSTDAVLVADAPSVTVPAADAVPHGAIPIGVGSGRPGQTFTLPGAPLVAGAGFAVAVEVRQGEEVPSGSAVLVDGNSYRYCTEVAAFPDAAPDQIGVTVDRTAGTLVFAWWADDDAHPPLVPPAGARIVAWYRTGGGERGNLAAGALTVLRTPIAGVRVTNPGPATGGRDTEPLADALRRAPQQFQARDRAVTARDYEVLATTHGGVARAKAITRRDVWSFARAGEVEVVLVPHVPVGQRPSGRVSADLLAQYAKEEVRGEVDAYLRQRATVGAEVLVRWARSKTVLVEARVVVRSDDDREAIRARIEARFADAINPLTTGSNAIGSGFGRPLRVSNLYRAMEESEPGVQYVDRVRLEVDQVPDDEATGLVRAPGQSATWFVAQRTTLFRSTNAGGGWEACATFAGEEIRAISPFPVPAAGRASALSLPGTAAVVTSTESGSRVYVTSDLGDSWRMVAELGFALADLAWIERQGRPVLLLAGEKGLYELAAEPGSVPVQNLVDPAVPDRGFYTVDSFTDLRGRTGVVVAAEAAAGIWLSPDAGAAESFSLVRPAGDEVRCLAVQYDGPQVALWVGTGAPDGSGAGCLRLKLEDLARTTFDEALVASWESFDDGWTGGTCWGVQVVGDAVYAATQSAGVLRLPLGAAAAWDHRDVNSGLPLRDRERFEPVRGVSGEVFPDGTTVVLAAGPRGVFRSYDAAESWRTCSARIVDDVVTLPETWLFTSGEHRIEVVTADAG